MWTTLAIVAFLVVIVYNLGAGLYFMMTDKGETDRTVKALTRRIALSVLLILLVMLGILVFGIAAYRQLPVSDLPNVDFPTIQVTAQLPGASPETMASAVATPLEKQFSTIPSVDSMTSQSGIGQTQITLQDGDTIAIGGIIQEQDTESSAGIPFLHRIPVLGAAFGNKTKNTSRTELIVFFTPHVIYDTTGLAEATDDLKAGLKHMKKELKQTQ